MRGDRGERSDVGTVLRADGGMSASDGAMEFLSGSRGASVDRPKVLETTALGVARLAGQRAQVCPGQEEFAAGWALDRRFEPKLDADTRSTRYAGWSDAVSRTLSKRD